MKKLKKFFVLVLIAVVVSIGFTGCKGSDEHPSGDHPTKETAEKVLADYQKPFSGGQHNVV